MKFQKPALTWENQAQLLLDRGLIADKDKLICCLESVNYYRLSSYFHPFKNQNDNFRSGTTLNQIWKRYTFDRRLRLIVLDAIERFEISVKTRLSYQIAHKLGPFGYTIKTNYPYVNRVKFTKMIDIIQREVTRTKEHFVINYFQQYKEKYLPIWKATEVTSFGSILTLYRNIEKDVRQKVSGFYKVDEEVLLSWINAIHSIRNICAHHARLWNRVLGVKPQIPDFKNSPEFHHPINIKNDRIFGILTILKYLLNIIAPQSFWDYRLRELFKEYPDIPKYNMGIPENWNDCPIWK